MSYLNGPRINFYGGISINVDTANNDQYTTDGKPLLDLNDASVCSAQSDDDVIAYLREEVSNSKGQPYFVRGGWNYYGDHQVVLQQAKVSSSGAPGAMNQTGGLQHLPVYLLGGLEPGTGKGPYGGAVMVDIDPTSSVTSQIYAGGFQIGGGDTPALLVQGHAVSHSRLLGLRYSTSRVQPPYLTPGSAWASGTFQLAFRKQDIVSFDDSDPVLAAIINDPRSQGLVVRYSLFECFPGNDSASVRADLKANQNNANPSLGRVIGSVGAWYADELASDPLGRLLPNVKLGGAQGLAWLDESAARLSLDLVSALEGDNIRSNGQANTGPIGPNLDYGNLIISAGERQIASVPSNPGGYYEWGGLYDVALSTEAVALLKAHPIQITSDKNDLQITESRLRISSDARNLYTDPSDTRKAVTVRVHELGGPLLTPVVLQLSTSSPGTLEDGQFLEFPATVQVPAGATEVTIDLEFNAGSGFSLLEFKAVCASDYHMAFRRYPEHDYSALINAGNIAWADVYEHCLRFFYVLFPAMSKRIPLNDEATIQAVAGELLKRIDESYRPTTLYMPLTRALSPGKVALLRAYLNQLNGD
ncbi:hypothetical protein [Gilvimarinus polysaccharolyticus]|uniref:hypothetical protein n=1 Tax=Gilvimarinus polysaccharolyticus TaxID=863921 RepID=UPI00067362C4|nr:hypothetical protein [Gilvimarinus polysaccharolyticus]